MCEVSAMNNKEKLIGQRRGRETVELKLLAIKQFLLHCPG